MKELSVKFDIEDLIDSVNVAEDMDDKDLSRIAQRVIEGFEDDKRSRSEWERETNKALELASMSTKTKNTPWPDASNVKYPLITTAAMQFAARTYPEIIRNGKVVEVAAVGYDADGAKEARARRVAEHMSYQLLIQHNEFEEATDKLLHMLPIVGTVFKKTYFDPVKQRIVSELCLHDEIYVHNDVKCIEEARRVTHVLHLHKNDIIENMRSGVFREIPDEELREGIEDIDRSKELHEILEQHTYLDLDGDGYEEPYIVTLIKSSGKVLRIFPRFTREDVEINDKDEVLRITPIHYFTDYHFIPSPDGTYYSVGFGRLMRALNESVNTILNQLIDAGTLANTQTGFLGRGLRIKGGQIRMRPGQWHKLDSAGVDDIRKHIVPLDYKEPSAVLFQLLGTLVDASKELSSVNDAMRGQENAQNVPATTILALIEQGTKVFSAIQRRMYRALKKEFEKMYALNRLFLDPEEYARVLDHPGAVLENDYEDQSLDIHPIADPHMASDAQRLARAQAQLSLLGQPGINSHEVMFRYLDSLNTPNIEAILPPPDPNAPPPLEVIEAQAKMDTEGKKLELKALQTEIREKDTLIRAAKAEAEIEKTRAEAIKAIAEAEAAEAGTQIEAYKAQVEALVKSVKSEAAKNTPGSMKEQEIKDKNPLELNKTSPEEDINENGSIPGLEETPGNGELPQSPTE